MYVAVQYEVKLPDGTVVDKSPEEGVEYKLKDGELCLFESGFIPTRMNATWCV